MRVPILGATHHRRSRGVCGPNDRSRPNSIEADATTKAEFLQTQNSARTTASRMMCGTQTIHFKLPMPTHATLATPPTPGAVAVIELTGDDARALLTRVTGIAAWECDVVRLANFGDVDQGLAVLINDAHAQFMPHAGPRVVQRLMALLIEHGAVPAASSALQTAPETTSPIESELLDALWRAASPAAIDLLLAQPRLWREWLATNPTSQDAAQVAARSKNLDRLITPPSVVIVGSPNVGKSALTNAILGRRASIVADMPGTTRDFVSSPAEIDGVALRWFDTPGVRITPDAIETQAIALARNTIANADILVVIRDSDHDWPSRDALPRTPDLHVIGKSDRGVIARPGDPSTATHLSAHTGAGLDQLTQNILAKLGLSRDDRTPHPWAFSPRLRELLSLI